MSNRYWRGRPKARQANVMFILAGVLVGVVLGFGLASFTDIDPSRGLDYLRGGPEPVRIAKQYTREVLQPRIEEQTASSVGLMSVGAAASNISSSFDIDWEYGEPVCTSGAGEGDCSEYDVPTTGTVTMCLENMGLEWVVRTIIYVDTEDNTATHTPGRTEPRSMVC